MTQFAESFGNMAAYRHLKNAELTQQQITGEARSFGWLGIIPSVKSTLYNTVGYIGSLGYATVAGLGCKMHDPSTIQQPGLSASMQESEKGKALTKVWEYHEKIAAAKKEKVTAFVSLRIGDASEKGDEIAHIQAQIDKVQLAGGYNGKGTPKAVELMTKAAAIGGAYVVLKNNPDLLEKFDALNLPGPLTPFETTPPAATPPTAALADSVKLS